MRLWFEGINEDGKGVFVKTQSRDDAERLVTELSIRGITSNSTGELMRPYDDCWRYDSLGPYIWIGFTRFDDE